MESIIEEKIDNAFFERQLVVLKLGTEYLCVDISEVKEISKVVDITPVPDVGNGVVGVINLRGQILTVIDLGQKLGLPTMKNEETMRFLVYDSGDTATCFIVDACSEVLRITGDVIKDAPKSIVDKIDSQYLQGVVVLDDRLISIIDLGKIMSLSSNGGEKTGAHRLHAPRKKLLIIEDSSMMRGTLKSYIDKDVYEVIESADGEDGVQKAKNLKPDVVLLDIQLPRKNGVQVLREIKAMDESIEVIMESSVYQDDIKKTCMDLGAKAYLKKPVMKKDLENVLKA